MKFNYTFLFAVLFFSFTKNLNGYPPYSGNPWGNSWATNVAYNTPEGLPITLKNTVNESTVFNQSYKKNKTVVFEPDTSYTLIPKDRELAYKYYTEIPGVVWIEKTLFCDETEIANIYWQEYLNSKKRLSSITEGKSAKLVQLGYFTEPQFYFFPVVEISYEEAVDFCKWRTEIVTRNYNLLHGNSLTDKTYTVFEFQLPTESEWVRCASYGVNALKYPSIFTDSLLNLKINTNHLSFLQALGSNADENSVKNFNSKIKKDYVFNCRRTDNDFLNLVVPYYIWANPTNQFGCYNILGNVSEMTKEKGLAKGGSYLDYYKDCTPSKKFYYTKPERNIGFRCVCKLKWPNQ